MKRQQNQLLIALLGVIIVLLIVIVIIFATQKKVTEAPPQATKDTVYVPETRTAAPRPPDSTRVTDPVKLSAIQNFFERYSAANKNELVDELTDLYVYPAIYSTKVFDRDKMRKTITRFFATTEAVDHYFSDISLWEYQNGEITAYANEHHFTIDPKTGKESKITVYKNYHLIPTESGYKCREQHNINISRGD